MDQGDMVLVNLGLQSDEKQISWNAPERICWLEQRYLKLYPILYNFNVLNISKLNPHLNND